MNREEFITRIKAELLFNNIDIPEWANWITMDGDHVTVYCFETKPTCKYTDLIDNKDNFNFWDFRTENNKNFNAAFLLSFSNRVDYPEKKALVPIDELFNE